MSLYTCSILLATEVLVILDASLSIPHYTVLCSTYPKSLLFLWPQLLSFQYSVFLPGWFSCQAASLLFLYSLPPHLKELTGEILSLQHSLFPDIYIAAISYFLCLNLNPAGLSLYIYSEFDHLSRYWRMPHFHHISVLCNCLLIIIVILPMTAFHIYFF